MQKPLKAFAGATQVASPLDDVSPAEDWRLARSIHVDLQAMGMPRVNLLLVGADSVIQNVIETLLMDLREPIAHWSVGEPLVLPPESSAGTMILHDVGTLPQWEQRRLLRWLEQTTGPTQVVSTSAVSLLPRVQNGSFVDTLYYRLNTICLDVA
jgi:transcriptional regulator of aromatic amino acid metabolism